MSNSVDPDETAHYEPSDLNLCCLQKLVIIACGSERVKQNFNPHSLTRRFINSCLSLSRKIQLLEDDRVIHFTISALCKI